MLKSFARSVPSAVLFLCLLPLASRAAEIPKVGGKAPDFSLMSLDDQPVKLSALTAEGPVVLVVLRGWPGYQCPNCDGQVNNFIQAAAGFAKAGARVVFVYPGPANDLTAHATEFKGLKGRIWPKNYLYALDPAYTMVNAYGLRWNAPGETAYPSTFVVDKTGTVRFETISHSHGDRSKAAALLVEVEKLAK